MYVIIYMGLFRSARAPWATPAGALSNAPEVELLESVKATEIALATRRRSPPKYSHIASLAWLSLPLAPALSAEPEPKRLEKLQPVVSARRKKRRERNSNDAMNSAAITMNSAASEEAGAAGIHYQTRSVIV